MSVGSYSSSLRTRRRISARARSQKGDLDTLSSGDADVYSYAAMLLRGDEPAAMAGPQQRYAWVPYRNALYLPLWLRSGHNEWWRLRRVLQQPPPAPTAASAPAPAPAAATSGSGAGASITSDADAATAVGVPVAGAQAVTVSVATGHTPVEHALGSLNGEGPVAVGGDALASQPPQAAPTLPRKEPFMPGWGSPSAAAAAPTSDPGPRRSLLMRGTGIPDRSSPPLQQPAASGASGLNVSAVEAPARREAGDGAPTSPRKEPFVPGWGLAAEGAAVSPSAGPKRSLLMRGTYIPDRDAPPPPPPLGPAPEQPAAGAGGVRERGSGDDEEKAARAASKAAPKAGGSVGEEPPVASQQRSREPFIPGWAASSPPPGQGPKRSLQQQQPQRREPFLPAWSSSDAAAPSPPATAPKRSLLMRGTGIPDREPPPPPPMPSASSAVGPETSAMAVGPSPPASSPAGSPEPPLPPRQEPFIPRWGAPAATGGASPSPGPERSLLMRGSYIPDRQPDPSAPGSQRTWSAAPRLRVPQALGKGGSQDGTPVQMPQEAAQAPVTAGSGGSDGAGAGISDSSSSSSSSGGSQLPRPPAPGAVQGQGQAQGLDFATAWQALLAQREQERRQEQQEREQHVRSPPTPTGAHGARPGPRPTAPVPSGLSGPPPTPRAVPGSPPQPLATAAAPRGVGSEHSSGLPGSQPGPTPPQQPQAAPAHTSLQDPGAALTNAAEAQAHTEGSGKPGQLGRPARAASAAAPMGRVKLLRDVPDSTFAGAERGEAPQGRAARGEGGRARGRAYEWELAVSCFGEKTRPAERLISWTRVCALPGGDLPLPAALLAAEQHLGRMSQTLLQGGAGGVTARTSLKTRPAAPSSQPARHNEEDEADEEEEEEEAAALASARAASGIGVTADAFQSALRRVTLREVSGRSPSEAQRRRLEGLVTRNRMWGLDPSVLYAICPDGLSMQELGGSGGAASSGSLSSAGSVDSVNFGSEGSLSSTDDEGEGVGRGSDTAGSASRRIRSRAGSGGSSGNGGGGSSDDSDWLADTLAAAAASAAPPGLLLHHVLAVQQLVEATENAYEAGVAADAAADGRPPPATRRQLKTVRSLMRRAARGVDSDPGPWLRGVFRGAVPERRLRHLVGEMVQEEYGTTVREYDLAREHHFRAAMESGLLELAGWGVGAGADKVTRGSSGVLRATAPPPPDPIEELLRLLDRKGAKEVIDRLKQQVDRLPQDEFS